MSQTEGPQSVVALSWIVELPRDLGLQEDARADVVRFGSFHGWSGDSLRDLPRWDAADQAGAHPIVALRFRRARVGIGMPTEATDRCFSDMQTADMSRAQRRSFERNLERLVKAGVREWKTVVRITRWYLGSGMVDAGANLDPWLRQEFRGGLSVLNDWLGTYALASGNLLHGPVSLADLPMSIPVVMEGKENPDDDVVYGHRLLAIHDSPPALVPTEGDVAAAETASKSLLMDGDDNPFLDALKVLFQAQTHLASGRERQAVLDGGTGIEMLLAAIFRAVSQARDSFDGEAARTQKFKPRYRDQLPMALGDGDAPARDLAGARAGWWRHGYLLRNRVVHEGAEATPELADLAVASAWDLVAACGTLFRESKETAAMGNLLRVEWHSSDVQSAEQAAATRPATGSPSGAEPQVDDA